MDKDFFYFISDDYYDKFKNEDLMTNKETINGILHSRPCYYAFQDEEESSIYWMIPVSSQTDKYKDEYNESIKRYNLCDTISFGYLKGEYNAFLLQNMCPVTFKYILNKYFIINTTNPVHIPNDLKRELNAKARKIIRLAQKGKKLTFTNILLIKEALLAESNQNSK